MRPASTAHLARAIIAPALIALGACGSTSTGESSPPTRSAPSSSAVSPAATPTPQGAAVVTLGEGDNGRSITVRRGDRVVVTLASTYWTIAPPGSAAVLRQAGAPTSSPRPSGCVPGGGCGTVSAAFDAVGGGLAQLRASRTTCGEALLCQGSQGSWQVTVTVAG